MCKYMYGKTREIYIHHDCLSLCPSLPNQGCSLWVGNINSDTVTEEMLCEVFEK